jgi:membrane dipeptidase
VAKAKAIHNRVLKLDTHNDIDPGNFTPECNYTKRLTTQVNLPKMADGDMDVAFFIVYVGQGLPTEEAYDIAYKEAISKFDAVHRFTEKIAPEKMGLALTPKDVRRLHKQGKRVAVIGVENAYPIGTDVKRVKEFYDRGGRYMSLAHNGNSQLADSNTGEASGYLHKNGLSPLGREVIAEMNRLGMMVDLSHPSKGANLEAIRLSKAPVIASHSSARALADHSRNMDDEQLLAVKQNGGVVQIVGFASYLKVDSDGYGIWGRGAGRRADVPAAGAELSGRGCWRFRCCGSGCASAWVFEYAAGG